MPKKLSLAKESLEDSPSSVEAGKVEAGGRTRVKQLTLASPGSFERYGKKTRREKFLKEMDPVMPWSELEGLIEGPRASRNDGDGLYSLPER